MHDMKAVEKTAEFFFFLQQLVTVCNFKFNPLLENQESASKLYFDASMLTFSKFIWINENVFFRPLKISLVTIISFCK